VVLAYEEIDRELPTVELRGFEVGRLSYAGQAIRVPMTDPRWPTADGWVRMTQNVNGVEIHYVLNTVTGAVDDFKFVLPPLGGVG
jgi:hypothetical protein